MYPSQIECDKRQVCEKTDICRGKKCELVNEICELTKQIKDIDTKNQSTYTTNTSCDFSHLDNYIKELKRTLNTVTSAEAHMREQQYEQFCMKNS